MIYTTVQCLHADGVHIWTLFDILYIQPGQPQQNAYGERFNRTVRYDWLNQMLFDSIDDVQEQATK